MNPTRPIVPMNLHRPRDRQCRCPVTSGSSEHRLYCGNALDEAAYAILMKGEKAAAAFTDMPYNLAIDGHVSGNGRVKHRELAMGSGEMSEQVFTEFLTSGLKLICAHSVPGAVVYSCIDWRHVGEMVAAGKSTECDLLNLCVWVKSNGGMGSFYRSRHELVFPIRAWQRSTPK
jgi:hypothetical protein